MNLGRIGRGEVEIVFLAAILHVIEAVIIEQRQLNSGAGRPGRADLDDLGRVIILRGRACSVRVAVHDADRAVAGGQIAAGEKTTAYQARFPLPRDDSGKIFK